MKYKNFSGQPIISQVLKFIPTTIITQTAKNHMSDLYYKSIKNFDHLVTMIFANISGSSSLREVTSIILACEGKTNHLGLSNYPKRNTLPDASKKRSSKVFAAIYQTIYSQYKQFLSDSNPRTLLVRDLKIIDSSTIGLFSNVLKGAGQNSRKGKKKDGIRMYAIIRLNLRVYFQ